MSTITFERSGGVIGNELHLDLDIDSLAEYESQYLQKLIEDSDFFNVPANLAMQSTPDEFLYTVTVDDGDKSHTVRVTDTTMPPSLLRLVKELTMLRVLH